MRRERMWMAGATLLMLGALAACATAGARDPVVAAKAIEAKADAMYGEFTIAEERVVAMLDNPSVPDGVKLAAQKADQAASPVLESIEASSKKLAKLRVTAPDEVPAAILALDELLRQGAPLLTTLQEKAK